MAVHAGRALFEQGIGDRRGNAQRGVLVWVYDAGTSTLSTLYTDRTKATEQDNPLSTNGLGNLAIYADPGDYEAHVDSTGAVLYFTVLPDWEDVVTGDEPEGGLPAHLADAVDAHDASAVSFTPAAGVAATDVQAAIVEVAGDVTADAAGLAAHLGDAVDSHDASSVSVIPTGGIAATTVQDALAELDTEKATSAALTSGLAGKQDTIPPGTYAKPATSGTLAARPTATVVGQRYLATDTAGGTLYESLNGSTWTQMAPGLTGFVPVVGSSTGANAKFATTEVTNDISTSYMALRNHAYNGDTGTRIHIEPRAAGSVGGALKIFGDKFEQILGVTQPYRDCVLAFLQAQQGDQGQHGTGAFFLESKTNDGGVPNFGYLGRSPDMVFAMQDGQYVGGRFVRLPTCHVVGTTNGSATATDPLILAVDQGKRIETVGTLGGTGIPVNSYVGTVTPGVGFLLSSSATSQVDVLATATQTTTSYIGVPVPRMVFVAGKVAANISQTSQEMVAEIQGDLGFCDDVGGTGAGKIIRWYHSGGKARNVITLHADGMSVSPDAAQALDVKAGGSVAIGPLAANAPAATTGYLELPTSTGAPSAAPTVSATKAASTVEDVASPKLWVYVPSLSAWRQVGLNVSGVVNATSTDVAAVTTASAGATASLTRTGRWSTPRHATRTTLVATLSRCYYIPFRVRKTRSYDRIGAIVTSGVGTALTRMGIYADDGDGFPGGFLFRGVGIDSSASAAIEDIIALTLQPGMYWLAFVAQVAASTYRATAGYVENVSVGTWTDASASFGAFYETGVSAALPSTAAPTVDTTTAPLMALRAA